MKTIVFVCEHGAAKSVVAAGLFNQIARSRALSLRAVAKGTEPDAAIPPVVVEGLASDGIEPSPSVPERVSADDLAGAARIVSFGCDLSRLAPDGIRIDRWDGLPAVGDGYAVARSAIRRRVEGLLLELNAQTP